MLAHFTGKRGTIRYWSLGILFALALIEPLAYPDDAEAALLDALPNLAAPSSSAKQASEGSRSSESQGAGSDKPKSVAPAASNPPLLSDLQVNTPALSVDTPLLNVSVPSVSIKITTDQTPQGSSKPADHAEATPASPAPTSPPASAPTPAPAPSAGKASGNGLLPDVRVNTPAFSVDTPLLNVNVPSIEAKVTTDEVPQASVIVPAIKADTPILHIKTPAVEAQVPLTPNQVPDIKVEPPAIQVETPVVDIQVPSIPVNMPPSPPKIPPSEEGKAGGGKEKDMPATQPDGAGNPLPDTNGTAAPDVSVSPSSGDVNAASPTQAEPAKAEPASAKPVKAKPVKAKPVKAKPAKINPVNPAPAADPQGGAGGESSLGSTSGATDFPEAAARLDRSPLPAVPSETNSSIGQQESVKKQPREPESAPRRAKPANPWIAVLPTVYLGGGSTGGGAVASSGGDTGPFFGSPNILYLDILLHPPKITEQHHARSQLFIANQWSKPPPGPPPRYRFFSSAVF